MTAPLSLFLLWLSLILCPSTAFLNAPPTTPPTDVSLSSSSTCLYMAKKNAAAKKIQVKMLKDVPGTGQRGDIVMVTPPFFNNKLRAQKAAEPISDEEVAAQVAEQEEALEQEKAEATQLKEALESKTLELKRKAGPEGNLFGGVHAKNVMEEIVAQFPGHEQFWNKKSVKVTSLTDGNGKKMRGDIKTIGEFGATISLTKDIKGSVKLNVVAEE